MLRPLARHVSSVSCMNIKTRTVKNTRDGKQTILYAKPILKALLQPCNLKVLTVYLNDLWSFITCATPSIMEMATAKVSTK